VGAPWNYEFARQHVDLSTYWLAIRVGTNFLGIIKELQIVAGRIFALEIIGYVRVVTDRYFDRLSEAVLLLHVEHEISSR